MLWFWHLIWSSSFAAIVAGEWMVMPTLESTFCPQGGHKCWLREWPRKSVELTLNSSCSLFLKKSMGFGGHVGSAWGENEELPAIDLRRISWPCQLMTSGDESRNTHPWVTLKKKKIFFPMHAEMLISDSQQETIGHRCLWESPAFALRDLGLRWCQPLGHCTSYFTYRN